jgi:ATP-dependent DNA ligase
MALTSPASAAAQAVEVEADHITDGHFRHGSRILRWRDDKRGEACMMEQLRPR